MGITALDVESGTAWTVLSLVSSNEVTRRSFGPRKEVDDAGSFCEVVEDCCVEELGVEGYGVGRFRALEELERIVGGSVGGSDGKCGSWATGGGMLTFTLDAASVDSAAPLVCCRVVVASVDAAIRAGVA